MKTVIVQSLWGGGILRTHKATSKNERALHQYCIPSVRHYADRHGYSYILHRPDKLHFHFTVAQDTMFVVGGKDKAGNPIKLTSVMNDERYSACFERFYVMNGIADLYDRFIYLDLDVYIKPDAPAMPYEKGVWAYHEDHIPHSVAVAQGFSEVPHSHQFNSGVLVLNRKGVKSLYDYVRHVKPDPRCTGDQDYFRLWSLKNKVNKMSAEWNYMVFKGNKEKRGHVMHYIDKKLMHSELGSRHNKILHRCYEAIKDGERWVRHRIIHRCYEAIKDGERWVRHRIIRRCYGAIKDGERWVRHTRIVKRLRRWKKKR